jgi:radical SAM protein with 4Fe4S-binding SPASM domain
MNNIFPLFRTLEIETNSYCNRKCPGCLRNSTPNKDATESWFKHNQLPFDTIQKIFNDVLTLGFRGGVCLSHYNEPLADLRIVDIAKLAMSKNFSSVFMGSNADYLTEELAHNLDGNINEIGFALYMQEPFLSQRAQWIKSLFHKTKVSAVYGDHMITHYSPLCDDVNVIAAKNCNNVCGHPPKRLIINHKGEMLFCCDDLIGHFDLGNVYESTVEELWYSDKHQELVLALRNRGGRSIHPHCTSCPRP